MFSKETFYCNIFISKKERKTSPTMIWRDNDLVRPMKFTPTENQEEDFLASDLKAASESFDKMLSLDEPTTQ